VRAGTVFAVTAVLFAGGLTAWGNPSLETLWRGPVESLESEVAARTVWVLDELRNAFTSRHDVKRPGPTYAVIISGDSMVGIDRDGYVTCMEASFDDDLAVLTGFTATPDSIGARLTMPEVVLGLSIIGAFDRFAGMLELISEVHIEDLENPKVIVCGGVTVEVGAGGYATKIERLRQVLLQAPELGIRPTRVDMRFGPQVVVEYENTEKQSRKEV
jgi:hypothetical protein